MKLFFRNFFVPHEGNNYKGRFLHHPTLLIIITFFVISTFLLKTLNSTYPQVLGITTDITSEQLLGHLNKEREKNNLETLNLNPELSAAAMNKANDMFAKNYWSHNSPDGKTPWDFIKDSGYAYVYAGENLARGFTESSDVTKAWLESQSHKENMLSSNYSDVGFAIVTGTLNGEETVLVVEEFGNRNLAVLPKIENIQKEVPQESVPNPQEILVASSRVNNKPLIDSINFTSNFGVFIILLVIFSLFAEMAILERKKIAFFARHNPDHILFLVSILILMFILGKGAII